MPVTPAPGRIVHIEEADYRYGEGPIEFGIVQVGERLLLDQAPWIALKGRQRYSNGQYGELRIITARVGGISAARGGATHDGSLIPASDPKTESPPESKAPGGSPS